MELTKFSEYFALIATHDYLSSYEEQLDYLKKLEQGIESGNDAIILLCQIGQMKIADELLS
mgnify:CR=1 FL=1